VLPHRPFHIPLCCLDVSLILITVIPRSTGANQLPPVWRTNVGNTLTRLATVTSNSFDHWWLQEVLNWKTSRRFFYWRLRRLLLEEQVKYKIRKVCPDLNSGQMKSMMSRWFVEAMGAVNVSDCSHEVIRMHWVGSWLCSMVHVHVLNSLQWLIIRFLRVSYMWKCLNVYHKFVFFFAYYFFLFLFVAQHVD